MQGIYGVCSVMGSWLHNGNYANLAIGGALTILLGRKNGYNIRSYHIMCHYLCLCKNFLLKMLKSECEYECISSFGIVFANYSV